MNVRRLSRPLGSTLRILGLSAVLLMILEATALVCTLALSWWRGSDPANPVLLGSGVLCSLIIWLFVLIFHLKKETLTIPVQRRMETLGKLRQGLAELGYEVNQPSRERLVARPAFHSYLLGGTIQVQVDDKSAVVTGPKVSLERLHQRLRINQLRELTPLPRGRSAARVRPTPAPRAQVHFRLSRRQDPEVLLALVGALQERGVEASYDVHLLVDDDAGATKAVLEEILQQELKEQGVEFQLA